MKLEGSCHCGCIRFQCEAYAPVPFLHCYCSICRKTAGGGGSAVNLGARADTLEVEGGEHLGVYQARIRDDDGGCRISSGQRHFCTRCGSALWLCEATLAAQSLGACIELHSGKSLRGFATMARFLDARTD
ncbi:GFA family protein [Luteimonas sp. MJ246]|uniref:GFA family protein n=1 Tax=Luteimonas sp. MJ174 TaxID=3129237 RepID=UPI0031BB7B77